MPFLPKIKEEALVACGRHCCLCHKFCGVKMECHHIKPEADGGPNELANCMPLCFDCHADVNSYNNDHPKGNKFTQSELRRHRDNWYEKVKHSEFTAPNSYINIDRAVFQRLRNQITGPIILNFSRIEFGGIFSYDYINPLYDYRDKTQGDTNEEFIDSSLESMRVELLNKIGDFRSELAVCSFPHDYQRGLFSVPSEWEFLPSDSEKNFFRVQARLNGLADQVVESYNNLVSRGRRALVID